MDDRWGSAAVIRRRDFRFSDARCIAAGLLLTAVAFFATTHSVMAAEVDAVASFFSHVDRNGLSWLDERGADYVATLPIADRQRIASLAVQHADLAVRLFGVQLMFRDGSDSQANAAAVDLLLRGDDLTALAWSWLHSGTPGELERRLADLRAALAAREPTMTPEQRQRAERLLCENGCAPARDPNPPH